MHSAWIKEHCYFKAKGQYRPNDDYGRFMKQMTSYTVAGKNKNDDVVDSLSSLADFAQSQLQAKVDIFRRPF